MNGGGRFLARRFPRLAAPAVLVVAIGGSVLFGRGPSAAQLPLDPMRDFGQSVTAAYEGWFRNPDGTYSLLVGYFNRNHREALDIPIGPDNRIEPGGPDRAQPTHFLTRRQWGVFTISVPADFPGKKLVWTLVANGKPTEVPLHLNPLWEVDPYRDAAKGNTPPVVWLEPGGEKHQGPPRGIAASFEATVSEPFTLTVWTADDNVADVYMRGRSGPPVTLSWSKYRGPGEVSFSHPNPEVDPAEGKAVTTATLSAPGAYVLRLQANDRSGDGGGGAQCCWTNVHVRVVAQPGARLPLGPPAGYAPARREQRVVSGNRRSVEAMACRARERGASFVVGGSARRRYDDDPRLVARQEAANKKGTRPCPTR